MIQSVEKDIADIVWKVPQMKQESAIKELVQKLIEELQELLKAEEFHYGNYTEEIDEFISIYTGNL